MKKLLLIIFLISISGCSLKPGYENLSQNDEVRVIYQDSSEYVHSKKDTKEYVSDQVSTMAGIGVILAIMSAL